MSESGFAGQRLPTYRRTLTTSTSKKPRPRWQSGWHGLALSYILTVRLGQWMKRARYVAGDAPCHPGWRKLASWMACSESSARRTVAQLRRAGAVELVEQGGLGSVSTPNRRQAGRANVFAFTPLASAYLRGQEAPSAAHAARAPRVSVAFGQGRLLAAGSSVLPVHCGQPVRAIQKQKQAFCAPDGAVFKGGTGRPEVNPAFEDARRARLAEAAARLADVVSAVGRTQTPTTPRASILGQSGASGARRRADTLDEIFERCFEAARRREASVPRPS